MEDFTILISAAVSLVVSTAAFFVQRALNRRGKLRIRCTLTAPHIVWFHIARDEGGNIQLNIPIMLDVYNSSYTTKVMRDINMTLMRNGAEVMKLHQVNMLQYHDPHEGDAIEHIGSETGVYSFSIAANDVFDTWLLYVGVIPPDCYEDEFDEVVVSFVNHRDKTVSFSAIKFREAYKLGRPRNFMKELDSYPVCTVSR